VATNSCCDNGPRRHELEKRFEERLSFVFGVVLNEEFPTGCQHGEVNDVVTLGFDSAENFADEVSFDPVRFDEHEGVV
jgi:hypothetical protein